jgi:hypothetical protein
MRGHFLNKRKPNGYPKRKEAAPARRHRGHSNLDTRDGGQGDVPSGSSPALIIETRAKSKGASGRIVPRYQWSVLKIIAHLSGRTGQSSTGIFIDRTAALA